MKPACVRLPWKAQIRTQGQAAAPSLSTLAPTLGLPPAERATPPGPTLLHTGPPWEGPPRLPSGPPTDTQ